MYYFSQIIPFIDVQLNKYYSYFDYGRGEIANIADCSKTTVAKYESYKDHIPKEWQCYLDKCPNEERIIYTPWEDNDDYYWYAGIQGPIKKQKIKPPPAPIKDLTLKINRNPQLETSLFFPCIDSSISFVMVYPKSSGIYMLAQTTCLPNKINEHHYLIKVGMSETNLNNRINSYKGPNPLVTCVDIKTLPKEKVKTVEAEWHKNMEQRYTRVNGTEWFDVPFEDYKKFLENGFLTKI